MGIKRESPSPAAPLMCGWKRQCPAPTLPLPHHHRAKPHNTPRESPTPFLLSTTIQFQFPLPPFIDGGSGGGGESCGDRCLGAVELIIAIFLCVPSRISFGSDASGLRWRRAPEALPCIRREERRPWRPSRGLLGEGPVVEEGRTR